MALKAVHLLTSWSTAIMEMVRGGEGGQGMGGVGWEERGGMGGRGSEWIGGWEGRHMGLAVQGEMALCAPFYSTRGSCSTRPITMTTRTAPLLLRTMRRCSYCTESTTPPPHTHTYTCTFAHTHTQYWVILKHSWS